MFLPFVSLLKCDVFFLKQTLYKTLSCVNLQSLGNSYGERVDVIMLSLAKQPSARHVL